jgi:hypothetical protein
MSALGQKRTLGCLELMSALPPKADIGHDGGNVRFVPKADIQESARTQRKCQNFAHSRCSGRLPTMPDEDFVDHVEHTNSKLFWYCCEPWRGVQSGSGVGEPLLPSRFHGRAAELEIL